MCDAIRLFSTEQAALNRPHPGTAEGLNGLSTGDPQVCAQGVESRSPQLSSRDATSWSLAVAPAGPGAPLQVRVSRRVPLPRVAARARVELLRVAARARPRGAASR